MNDPKSQHYASIANSLAKQVIICFFVLVCFSFFLLFIFSSKIPSNVYNDRLKYATYSWYTLSDSNLSTSEKQARLSAYPSLLSLSVLQVAEHLCIIIHQL
jgi:hypothetical protein